MRGAVFSGMSDVRIPGDGATKVPLADELHAPQYGGSFAWAMTEPRLAVADPEVRKIVDGKQ